METWPGIVLDHLSSFNLESGPFKVQTTLGLLPVSVFAHSYLPNLVGLSCIMFCPHVKRVSLSDFFHDCVLFCCHRFTGVQTPSHLLLAFSAGSDFLWAQH